jgi:predicted AlkP superfamily phosphohydrolase/phosphomutase/Tfp pilus assembly protein PilF
MILAIGLLALLAGLGAGLFRVQPGQVAVRVTEPGAQAKVWESGWNWRTPFSAKPRRFPRTPLQLSFDLSVISESGRAIFLEASGRFRIKKNAESKAVQHLPDLPFVEALSKYLGSGLEEVFQGPLEEGDIFLPEYGASAASLSQSLLEAAGVMAESLVVGIPADKNQVIAMQAAERVSRFAKRTGAKVLVVGWDGADWLMIRPLLKAGRLPHLAALIKRGVSGDLRAQKPLLSPLLWTTMATGKPVLEHGIADFLVRDPSSGELVPISSSSRKVHALWSLLGPLGVRTDVIAWWATWPAEPINGTMVTDRVAYQLFDFEASASEAGKVSPPEEWGKISSLLKPAEEVSLEELQRFIKVTRTERDEAWQGLPPDRRLENKINHLRKILATTKSYHEIALSLLADQADLTMAYYEGTDTVAHLFARYLPPKLARVTAEEVAKYGAALPEFYAYADELLGELVAAADSDTYVLLVSDHGFFTGEARPTSDPSDFTEGAPQWHRLHGILVAAGPGIRPNRVENASIFDLTPTVLNLLGLPVPSDMPGRVPSELVPAAGAPLGKNLLASYEILGRERAAATERITELDRQRIKELAALGYVSGGAIREDAAQNVKASSPVPDTRAAQLEGIVTEAYNQARILQRQGDFDAAQRQYQIAIEREPSFGPAYGSLAQVESQRGRHCRALEVLIEGFGKSANLPMAAITGLIDEGAACGRLEEAGDVLNKLHPVYRSTSAFHAALGLLEQQSGRFDTALRHYGRALSVDPLDQLAIEQTVEVLRRQRREQEARSFFKQVVDKATGDVAAMNQLAVVALRQGWPGEAEKLLRRVLQSDPGNPGLLANLAASLMQQRRIPEAIEAISRAVERDPENARNYFNLGAMLAEQGRLQEALAAFDNAAQRGLRSARLHVAAAKMHFRLGATDRSGEELRKALEVDPKNREAAELLAILQQG